MSTRNFSITGQVVDIPGRRVFGGEVVVESGIIQEIIPKASAGPTCILPGFIDAHVHIESSMLIPSEFARLASVHGTVATVSDPHEIANVLGVPGVEYMLENGKQVPFKFFFGAPSCVPATPFETAGAELGPNELDGLLKKPEIRYLAEMMNWPGVVQRDPMVMQKLALARKYGKPIDGHAPGLTREQAEAYIEAGILTDHECVSIEEARHKLAHGMKILIREGSAARNFDALIGLLPAYEDMVMFCSDDKHPDSLVAGHINQLVNRAIAKGIDLFSILKAACVNPVSHFGLDVGQLRPGDPADFIVVDDLKHFRVLQTYSGGTLIADQGRTTIPSVPVSAPNCFQARPVIAADFRVRAEAATMQVMEAHDGQLITSSSIQPVKSVDGWAVPDVTQDILKIVVVNRYQPSPPAVAFIRNFGLQHGAIASSVAHDCHNIVAVGVDDESLAWAVNAVIKEKGGISATRGGEMKVLPLPVAGIMSIEDGYQVAKAYEEMDRIAKAMGSRLGSPYMTLSFMALLVIPKLKLSDRGLFDGVNFSFTRTFVVEGR
jgi:adenine deaminase